MKNRIFVLHSFIFKIFNLRLIGGLRLLSYLWSGCCLFYAFPVSVLVFIGLQIESYIILEDSITVLFLFL